MGNLGFMGAEIKKIISKQNKISSTLFISSEIKNFARSYLPVFRGYYFVLQNITKLPMNKRCTVMDNFPLSETNWEIIQISSEIHKICSDIFPDQLSEVWGARKMWKRKKPFPLSKWITEMIFS